MSNQGRDQNQAVPENTDESRPWHPVKCLPYLDNQSAENLKLYRYAGGDSGYVYRYFYNPAATKLVTYLPDTLAPNLITLVGFCFSSLPFFVLFGAYGTSMYSEEGNEIPRWFYVLEAFCYLMYRLLDEMDGKQARRTGNSSPLGLLFDHGCDAFTMGLQSMVIVKCLQVGDNMKSVVCVLAPCASFHFSTLEEYYTGGLFLGPFNGVTDGSLAVIVCFLFMSVFGNNYWRWPIANAGTPNEIKLVDLMVFLNVTIQTVIIIMCLKAIFDHQKKSLGPNDITGEALNNKDLIVQVLGYFIPLVSLTLLAMMGEEPIIDYPAGRGQPSPLFYLILLQSLVMAHLTIQIQVNHCTKTLYSPFKSRLMLVELATVFFVYILHLIIPKSFTKQAFTDTIIVLFVVHIVFQAHYVLKVVKEMATALGIRVLCVKPKYPDADDDGPKLSTTTGLDKDDESRSPADLASKLGARRLTTDTQNNDSSGEHVVDAPEGLEAPSESRDMDDTDGGSSKLIS